MAMRAEEEEEEQEGVCVRSEWYEWRKVQEDGGVQARARGAAQAGTRPTTPGKLGCLGGQQRSFSGHQCSLGVAQLG